MPSLICPHCQNSQAVSDEVFQKNLGKKCRCRDCQKTFTIEVQLPAEPADAGGDFDWLNDDTPTAPAPVATPLVPAKPKSAAKTAAPTPGPPAVPVLPAGDDPDFSGLLGGAESPLGDEFPDFASSDEPSLPNTGASEFPSMEEVAPAAVPGSDCDSKSKTKVTESFPPTDVEYRRREVAPLVKRPSLKKLATALGFIGLIHVGITGLGGLLVLISLVSGSSGRAAIGFNLVESLIALFLFGVSALWWFALAELIKLGLAIEARLHEISLRTQPR